MILQEKANNERGLYQENTLTSHNSSSQECSFIGEDFSCNAQSLIDGVELSQQEMADLNITKCLKELK